MEQLLAIMQSIEKARMQLMDLQDQKRQCLHNILSNKDVLHNAIDSGTISVNINRLYKTIKVTRK